MDLLHFLYHTVPGRVLLKPLTAPGLSRFAGYLLDQPVSTVLIPGFVRSNHIDMDEYEKVTYHSFNEFFCRKIRPELRPVDSDPRHLASPCDGYLSIYPITDDLVIPVKQSRYTISSLLCSSRLAKRFEGGLCMVFRLCVNHYHRYCYPDSGIRSRDVKIDGILHTVRPVALETLPVFSENSREYCLLNSDHFGTLVQMEVGAMLVGKISNHKNHRQIKRGQEKGYFQYGGSTVILLVQKGRIRLRKSLEGAFEKPVHMGEMIALAADS